MSNLNIFFLLLWASGLMAASNHHFHHSMRRIQNRQATGEEDGVALVNVTNRADGTLVNSLCPTLAQSDANLASMLTYGQSGVRFPESLAEFGAYCNLIRDKTSSLDFFSQNCVPSVSIQGALNDIVYAVGLQTDVLCAIPPNGQPNSEQLSQIASNKCANSLKCPLQKCIRKMILIIQDAAKIKDPRKKLATACCNLNFLVECFKKVMAEGDQTNACSTAAAERMLAFLGGLGGCFQGGLCGEYIPGSDVCKPFVLTCGKSKDSPYRNHIGALVGVLGINWPGLEDAGR